MIRNILFAAANSSWTPLELFKNGEQGLWLDASDYSTLFQDSSGTTPVTSTSQPVGLWQDKSGTGNHLTQTTSSRRGQTATTGTRKVIQFDGVDDYLTRSSMTISGTDGITVGFGGYINSLSGGPTFVILDWNAIIALKLESTTEIASRVLGATSAIATGLSYPQGISLIAYGKSFSINNTLVVNGTTYTSDTCSSVSNNQRLDIPPVQTRGDVDVSQLIVVNRQLTTTEKTQLVDYLNSKA